MLGKVETRAFTFRANGQVTEDQFQQRKNHERRNRPQDPSVSVAPDGTTLIAWEDQLWEGPSQFSAENIFWVMSPAAGGWSDPELLGPGPAQSGVGRMSVLRDGDGFGILWRGSSAVYYTRMDSSFLTAR